MRTVHLIAPVTAKGVRTLGDVAHLKGPSLNFTLSQIDRGPPSIESEFDEALAVPGTIVRVIEAERDGADAIVIDCMGDPGLKPAREVVRVPVLGPAETSMHLAAMLGKTFSVVTILSSCKPILADLARVYGVHEKLVSILALDIPGLEIEQRFDEVQRSLARLAQQAVERDGADVIVLGCTGFIGCAGAIEKHLLAAGHEVPVIDPIPATVCMAEAIAKSGLRHSKRTYSPPRTKTIIGFDIPEVEKSNQQKGNI